MIRIFQMHRRPTLGSPDNPAISTCNAVIAADENHNKAHFNLTHEEEHAFNALCEKIENRIAVNIANPELGLDAVRPRNDEPADVAAAAAGSAPV